jgi:K+-transporting ATPase A subunit
MHDSLTPLGGMVVLINMMLNEVVFGGVGYRRGAWSLSSVSE